MIFNMNYSGGGGSGSGVGFSIVDGAIRPTKLPQNMFLACTEHESTGCAFSATKPEAQEDGLLSASIADKDGTKPHPSGWGYYNKLKRR